MSSEIYVCAGASRKMLVLFCFFCGVCNFEFPIERIYIIRSIPVIERELRFPLDIDLSGLPPIVSNNSESVVSYLRLIDSNRNFASAILKIIIENRRTVHTERFNNIRIIVIMLSGDLFMASTTVQSDKANDKVAKICYAVRGSF